MGFEETSELLFKQFPGLKKAYSSLNKRFSDFKVIGCSAYKDSYLFTIVPSDATLTERFGNTWYDYFDNHFAVNKYSGKISDVSSLPDDVIARSKFTKSIFVDEKIHWKDED